VSEPFLAEVRMVGFNFAPRGWAFCDGQILPINQNQSLYSLLGTTYGGDGRTSFALPDLRGRAPVHVGRADSGADYRLGQKTGEENHTLSVNEMPQHTHETFGSSDNGAGRDPTGNLLGKALNLYAAPSNLTPIHDGSITNVGGGQAHNNMQPSCVLNFCIALQGLFPSRN
jgi:microcystin-dependent protein